MTKLDASDLGVTTGGGLLPVSDGNSIGFLPNGRSKFDIMPHTTATIAHPPFYLLRASPRPVKGMR